MSNVFTINDITMEIHYFEGNIHNLMVWMTNFQKPYFLTVEDYQNQLRQMKCRYADEIEAAIVKFLNQKESV